MIQKTELGQGVSISRGLRRQISLEYYTIPPATYTQAMPRQGRPCQPICSVCSKPGLPLASGWRTRVLKILSRITKDRNGREISNFGGMQCTIVASQASDTWPVSFCFKSFFKRKKKSDVIGGLTHCKNHVNLFHVRYRVKKKTINIDRDQ